MKLEGKVALVTGSNRGIGRGIALEMAKAGADVTVNYRTHAGEAEAVAAEIRGMGRRAIVVQADVSDRPAVESMVKATVAELGRLDICVNNSAHSLRRPFLEMTNAELERVFDVNVGGVFNCSQTSAQQMVKQGEGGAILIISSVLAFIPARTSLAYNASKAALNHMGHTMAEELLPHRIRVNVIEPGWIDTPGERRIMPDEKIRELAKLLPWKRLGTPEEIGKAAVFLCSPDADYITAATIRIDGGFWLPSRQVRPATSGND